MPHRFKVIAGFHFPWDWPWTAIATGSGAVLASLWQLHDLSLLLLVGVIFDWLLGVAAARRKDTLSIKTAEDRALTNLVIFGTSWFFFVLSDNAQHFKSVHWNSGESITDIYPIGTWITYTLMILVLRSIVVSLAVFNVTFPWLSQWLDKASAKVDAGPPPVTENPARGGTIVGG